MSSIPNRWKPATVRPRIVNRRAGPCGTDTASHVPGCSLSASRTGRRSTCLNSTTRSGESCRSMSSRADSASRTALNCGAEPDRDGSLVLFERATTKSFLRSGRERFVGWVESDDVLGRLVDLSPHGFHVPTIDGATDSEPASDPDDVPLSMRSRRDRTSALVEVTAWHFGWRSSLVPHPCDRRADCKLRIGTRPSR